MLILFSVVQSKADVVPTDEKQETVNKKSEDLPDSSPSSPPLATDDPGTPGPLGVEVNFIGNCNKESTTTECGEGIDANLGLGEYLQLRLSKEAVQEKAQGEPTFNGSSPTSLGIKYRFYDTNTLKLAVYPSYQVDDDTQRRDANGVLVDREGRSIYLPIIISKQFGHFVAVANIGYSLNTDFAEKSALVTSVAFGRSLSDTLRIMGEVAAEKPRDAVTTTEIRIGAVQEIFPNEKSKYETGIFGSIGQSVGATEDGETHTSYLIGLSVARKPN